MARIRPFKGWRYTEPYRDLSLLIAPPYDVVNSEQRHALLAADPHNAVALELPDGPLDPTASGNRYETGKRTWDAWRDNGVLRREDQPSVYVLEQSYSANGRDVVRRAFILAVALEPFEAGVILPHERTLPKALGDRYELIKTTGANFSQVFGLFDDPDCATHEIFSAICVGEPMETAVDAEGIESKVWATSDPRIIERLEAFMDPRQIFIADGHHRYTTALSYRDWRRATSPSSATEPDYDFLMMALVNMDDPDLTVLPTHRVADGIDFDAESFRTALAESFDIEPVAAGHPGRGLEGLPRPGFLFATRADDAPLLAVLKADVDPRIAIGVEASDAWKSLDVAVLQELVLDPLLDIHPDRPETLERLTFVKGAHEALEAAKLHDVAFILRPTQMQQLREVALAGETMPQKSTYFYPKLPTGLVFRSAE